MKFQGVSFAYPNCPDQPVLKGLTFTLHPGQMTALVGPNGSGKSTVAALLQNLYQPTEGQVLLDEEPVSAYEHHYLHQQVVLVGQEPVLFSGSVRDNIAYGLKSCSDEKVMAAARAARAEEFINEMEHGLYTDVGEKGNQLAVGQKQRLAIARALVRDPRVLILDEATSALDAESEQALQDWKSHGNRTVLVIAHRLHTVQNADQILVLKQGELQEHAQLMEGEDLYSYLVRQNQRPEGAPQRHCPLPRAISVTQRSSCFDFPRELLLELEARWRFRRRILLLAHGEWGWGGCCLYPRNSFT